jgi:hypothetical protein
MIRLSDRKNLDPNPLRSVISISSKKEAFADPNLIKLGRVHNCQKLSGHNKTAAKLLKNFKAFLIIYVLYEKTN